MSLSPSGLDKLWNEKSKSMRPLSPDLHTRVNLTEVK